MVKLEFKTVVIVITWMCLLVSGCKGDDGNDSLNNSSWQSQDEFKLETLDISKNLEKSQFQDLHEGMSAENPKHIGDHYYVYDSVYNYLPETEFDINDKIILDLKIVNDTDSNVYGDTLFQVEILLDNEWYTIPLVNYCFTDLAARYPPRGEYAGGFVLSDIDVNFIPGEYRVIKIYRMDDFEEKIISCSNFYLS